MIIPPSHAITVYITTQCKLYRCQWSISIRELKEKNHLCKCFARRTHLLFAQVDWKKTPPPKVACGQQWAADNWFLFNNISCENFSWIKPTIKIFNKYSKKISRVLWMHNGQLTPTRWSSMSGSLFGRSSAIMSTSMLPLKEGAWRQVRISDKQTTCNSLLLALYWLIKGNWSNCILCRKKGRLLFTSSDVAFWAVTFTTYRIVQVVALCSERPELLSAA